MLGRNKNQVFKAVLSVVPGFSFVLSAFSLVYGSNHLAPVRTHLQNEFFILTSNNASFKHKNYNISFFNHFQRLFYNVIVQFSLFSSNITCKFVSAGINKVHRLTVNNRSSFNRVASNARLVINNCNTTVQKSVKQSRFSNIRAPRNYNNRQPLVFHIFRRNSVLKLNIRSCFVNKIRLFFRLNNKIVVLRSLSFSLRFTKIRFSLLLCHRDILYRKKKRLTTD